MGGVYTYQIGMQGAMVLIWNYFVLSWAANMCIMASMGIGKAKAKIVMTADEFRSIQAKLGCTNATLAARTHTYPTRISNYRTGKATVPGPLAAYMRLAAKVSVL